MRVPSTAPSALLIDDGELEQFARVLRRMGVDHVRFEGDAYRPIADRPRDLLVTTWKQAQHLPRLEPSGEDAWEPVWICIHQQDFLPLRRRMRKMGVHYLVHTLIDPESLRLLVAQILYHGAERRGASRLPVGYEVEFRTEDGRRKALLAELSEDGARLLANHEVSPGDGVTLCLPLELGLEGVELRGSAVRCSPWEPDGREPAFAIVIGFDSLGPRQRYRLVHFLKGRQLGSRVTPLGPPPERVVEEPVPEPPAEAPRPAPASEREPVPAPDAEEPITLRRRDAPRSEYLRTVPALRADDPDAPDVLLGYDLSVRGMRVAHDPGLSVGSRFAVALHGNSREEPLVIQAEVERDDGPSGFYLRFVDLGKQAEARLRTLLEGLQPLESLREGDPEGTGLVVSRLIR